eukprot:4164041-Pyramimonas_sp.AAC.1
MTQEMSTMKVQLDEAKSDVKREKMLAQIRANMKLEQTASNPEARSYSFSHPPLRFENSSRSNMTDVETSAWADEKHPEEYRHRQGNLSGECLLLSAVLNGKVGELRKLVKLGVDVSVKDAKYAITSRSCQRVRGGCASAGGARGRLFS